VVCGVYLVSGLGNLGLLGRCGGLCIRRVAESVGGFVGFLGMWWGFVVFSRVGVGARGEVSRC